MSAAEPIPCIDLCPLAACGAGDAARERVVEQVLAAARDTGFLRVTGHGVQRPVLDELLAAARAFFDLSADAKLDVAPQRWNPTSPNAYRGYFPAATDGKEGFDIGDPLLVNLPGDLRREALLECNRFPEALAEAHVAAVGRYFDAMSALGAILVRAVVAGLGGAPDRVDSAFPRPGSASTLRFNAYPERAEPHTVARDGTPLCCASHVDNGILTLLYQDERAGLQVRTRDGGWRDVPYDRDAFVVNTGLAFQQLVGGRLAATPHRVRQADGPRLSVPFFFEPRPDLALDPAELGLAPAPDVPQPTGAESYAAFLDRAMRRFPEYDRPKAGA